MPVSSPINKQHNVVTKKGINSTSVIRIKYFGSLPHIKKYFYMKYNINYILLVFHKSITTSNSTINIIADIIKPAKTAFGI